MPKPQSSHKRCPPPMVITGGLLARQLTHSEAYRYHLKQAVRHASDRASLNYHLIEANRNRIWGGLSYDVAGELHVAVAMALNQP